MPILPSQHTEGALQPSGESGQLSTTQLYVDLTSPWAYLAHQRSTAAATDGLPVPAWVAVQRRDPGPLVGSRGDSPARRSAQEQLTQVRAQAGPDVDLPRTVPNVLPHPRPVAAAYAEAVDLGCAAAVRTVLLEAYWQDGQDIGDPEVLRRILPAAVRSEPVLCTGDPRREFGYLVSPAREPLTNQAYHLLMRWQQAWVEIGSPGPLALVGADGEVRIGAAALPPPVALAA